MTIAGSPIVGAGTFVFSLANDLLALENLPNHGFAVRTGTDTWAQRDLFGTTDRITVSDTSGTSASPVFDIASTYVGQTSITTLGAITAGDWQASTIATAHGGTGRTSIGGANTVLGVNTAGTGLPYVIVSSITTSTGFTLQLYNTSASAMGNSVLKIGFIIM